MARYIDADELLVSLKRQYGEELGWQGTTNMSDVGAMIEDAPTANVVEAEKYNDLRESFIDFVCSGVHNPALYCKNAWEGCVDNRGWCAYRRCNGFNPDGRGGEE